MKTCYVSKRFHGKTEKVIKTINGILDEYKVQGFVLTVRQLFYQLVSRDMIPNSQKEYQYLSRTLADARLAGRVDWDLIEDRTREVESNSHWESVEGIIDSCVSSFRMDKWNGQSNYVEVWAEKDAVKGILESVCRDLDVPYMSCRGFSSQTAMYEAAMRHHDAREKDRISHIIYLGDHDPSGLAMRTDIKERMFIFGAEVNVNSVALTLEQVEQYSLPPNPAKETDNRFKEYQKQFGNHSWELDALEPRVIRDLITGAVKNLRNEEEWEKAILHEKAKKEMLKELKNVAIEMETGANGAKEP